jgi:hypothetical protein
VLTVRGVSQLTGSVVEFRKRGIRQSEAAHLTGERYESTEEPLELGDGAGTAGVQHGDQIAARRDRVGEESAARQLLLHSQVRTLDGKDGHRVAAGIRRDEVGAVVGEYESVLTREGIGRRACARGAETAGGIATGE